MKKYKAFIHWNYNSDPEIIEVEVERETDKCIWINGRRVAKHSTGDCYFDSWEEAKETLLNVQSKYVTSLRIRLDTAKGFLGNIKGMKK